MPVVDDPEDQSVGLSVLADHIVDGVLLLKRPVNAHEKYRDQILVVAVFRPVVGDDALLVADLLSGLLGHLLGGGFGGCFLVGEPAGADSLKHKETCRSDEHDS